VLEGKLFKIQGDSSNLQEELEKVRDDDRRLQEELDSLKEQLQKLEEEKCQLAEENEKLKKEQEEAEPIEMEDPMMLNQPSNVNLSSQNNTMMNKYNQ